MDKVQLALVPLAAFWAVVGSLQSAAVFVNDMREAVVTGSKGGATLTPMHRKAIHFDWLLSMTGTVFACALFSGSLFWAAHYIEVHAVAMDEASVALRCVATFPLVGGFLFAFCAVSDERLMQHAIREVDGPD